MNAPRFPLMRLPVACSQLALRIMHPIQLVMFSTLSKKCKNVVESIKIRAKIVMISVGYYVELGVEFTESTILILEFNEQDEDAHWENGRNGLKKQLKLSKTVLIGLDNEDEPRLEFRMSDNRMELGEWLEHLKQIFDYPKTNIRFGEDSHDFDVDSLRETFQNIYQLAISHTGCYEFNSLVLQKFSHTVEILIVSPDCFEDSKIPHGILIQNYKWLSLPCSNPQTKLELNDFLMMNSNRGVDAGSLMKSLKEYNMFLRLWINGSNPQLEYLFVTFSSDIVADVDIIMKGIKYETMPETLRRPLVDSAPVRGGMDFHRYDGVKATVCIYNPDPDSFCLYFIVWYDHCIRSH
ncbi:hypothetical protein CAEBREN_16026 [Caenorhabditis brenneri]|uniref:Sdz-33 F-box domain-containing protein n=1 Tax=Caenorhabditis brenneri TaxID=135651 RepID=G0N0C1_CAEBE|nr:hypothetical protein CAEBREN_16026 [Caenorhabditis brenneri]